MPSVSRHSTSLRLVTTYTRLPVHARRGTNSQSHLVEVGAAFAGFQFGNHQAPEQFAGGFVEAKQHSAAGGLVAGIVEIDIVCADKDFAVGHDRAGIIFGAQPRDPLDVFGGLHVDARSVGAFFTGLEPGGKVLFLRGHVARIVAAPLRPVVALSRRQHDPQDKEIKRLQIANFS